MPDLRRLDETTAADTIQQTSAASEPTTIRDYGGNIVTVAQCEELCIINNRTCFSISPYNIKLSFCVYSCFIAYSQCVTFVRG